MDQVKFTLIGLLPGLYDALNTLKQRINEIEAEIEAPLPEFKPHKPKRKTDFSKAQSTRIKSYWDNYTPEERQARVDKTAVAVRKYWAQYRANKKKEIK